MVSFSTDRPSKRRSSRLSSKQRVFGVQDRLKPTPPRLALDTSFVRHNDRAACQVFPSGSTQSTVVASGHGSGYANAGSTPHAITRVRTIHQHIRKLKPSPLDLTASSYPSINRYRSHHSPVATQGPTTPSILITPASDDRNGLQIVNTGRPRATSSVYSRYTNFDPESAFTAHDAPPVPPLPSRLQLTSSSTAAMDQKDAKGRVAAISVCTVFEEDQPATLSPFLQQDVGEPLPSASSRRSRGWWNFVTSPFSARSNAFTWRSPTSTVEERTPILSGLDGASREVFNPSGTPGSMSSAKPADVKAEFRSVARSATSPAALRSSRDAVDIYWIPSQGEAATYYDLARRFPSLILDEDSHEARRSALVFPTDINGEDGSQSKTDTDLRPDHHPTQRSLFTTPNADELATPAAFHILQNGGGPNNPLSPLSPSPVVERAWLAQAVGPNTLHGERREVDVTPSPTPPSRQGLAAATMASRPTVDMPDQPTQTRDLYDAAPYQPYYHSRNSSRGLGIYGSEDDLTRPTAVLAEKPTWADSTTAKSRPWYRRFMWLLLLGIAVFMGTLVTLLVIFIPQKRDDIPLQGQWVNLTGFPALPVGVLTVIQPRNVRSESGCADHNDLWSCQAPSAQSSKDILPDFRLEIRFKNDTALNSSMLQPHQQKRSTMAFASRIAKASMAMVARDLWSSRIFDSSPTPPSVADQIFLGNTTDNTTAPFEGEVTPFYLSLLSPADVLSDHGLQRRDDQVYPLPQTNNSTSSSSDSSSHAIPKMSADPSGMPLPQMLYPFADAQPVRLFKRGKADEHYGFYTYYDRMIYLNSSQNGSPSSSAACSWSQTRFLVQIWTRNLLPHLQNGNSSAIGSGDARSKNVAAANSTANVMSAPGSFPYPVTLTIDRHGGDGSKKGLYCTSLNTNGRIGQNSGSWLDENRSFGGTLVNPAAVPGSGSKSSMASSGQTGIDGGTGGCACAFQNW